MQRSNSFIWKPPFYILLNKLKNWLDWAINGRVINDLRFSDDTVLHVENDQELQELLDEVNINRAECGLDIKINKSKTTIISSAYKTKQQLILQ